MSKSNYHRNAQDLLSFDQNLCWSTAVTLINKSEHHQTLQTKIKCRYSPLLQRQSVPTTCSLSPIVFPQYCTHTYTLIIHISVMFSPISNFLSLYKIYIIVAVNKLLSTHLSHCNEFHDHSSSNWPTEQKCYRCAAFNIRNQIKIESNVYKCSTNQTTQTRTRPPHIRTLRKVNTVKLTSAILTSRMNIFAITTSTEKWVAFHTFQSNWICD